MTLDTTTKIIVFSSRMNQGYEISRFSEYSIDIDMETDCDQFNLVFQNPNGSLTGIISKYDYMEVWINGEGVICGYVDEVHYISNSTQSQIQIVGRDLLSPLVDNDALPDTLTNVSPNKYLTDKCGLYNLYNVHIDNKPDITKKLIIGTGESELSIVKNMITDDVNVDGIWTEFKEIHMGKWRTSINPDYYFTRGVPDDKKGVPYQDLELTDSGLDLKSQVKIYGSMNDGKDKIVGTANNPGLVDLGIKKVHTITSSDNDSTTKYSASALKHVKDDFRSGVTLKITVKTGLGYNIIRQNRTAQVIDSITRINSIFFIKGVEYRKTPDSGSWCHLTMVPGDETFDVLWTHTNGTTKIKSTKSNSNIVGTPDMTINELINSRK